MQPPPEKRARLVAMPLPSAASAASRRSALRARRTGVHGTTIRARRFRNWLSVQRSGPNTPRPAALDGKHGKEGPETREGMTFFRGFRVLRVIVRRYGGNGDACWRWTRRAQSVELLHHLCGILTMVLADALHFGCEVFKGAEERGFGRLFPS